MIDLESQVYGTHSLRRTKVSLVYRKTGNLHACELLPQPQETGDYGPEDTSPMRRKDELNSRARLWRERLQAAEL